MEVIYPSSSGNKNTFQRPVGPGGGGGGWDILWKKAFSALDPLYWLDLGNDTAWWDETETRIKIADISELILKICSAYIETVAILQCSSQYFVELQFTTSAAFNMFLSVYFAYKLILLICNIKTIT